jgi:carboxylesterase
VSDAESALKDLLTEAEKAIVIGHSMGGLVTVMLAADYGDQIDSIVLAAAAIQLRIVVGPGRPLSFLAPLIGLVIKKWGFAPIYADPSLTVYNTNYRWAPTDAILSLFDLSRVSRNRLAEVKTPTLILQCHNDPSVAPASANVIYQGISTPDAQKRIVWFERSGHEMFRDCERGATVDEIVKYVQERIGAK